MKKIWNFLKRNWLGIIAFIGTALAILKGRHIIQGMFSQDERVKKILEEARFLIKVSEEKDKEREELLNKLKALVEKNDNDEYREDIDNALELLKELEKDDKKRKQILQNSITILRDSEGRDEERFEVINKAMETVVKIDKNKSNDLIEEATSVIKENEELIKKANDLINS